MEELLRRGHQVGRARAHPLRVAHDGHGALGQHVEQQLHVVDEDGGEGLHALDRDALGDLAEEFAQLGVLLGEGRGALAHLVGEQQLTAGRRPQAVLGDLQGALVGDLEVADLLDVVAPELDAQGVFLGRREDIEDAAAHGELAALLDEFDTGVGGRSQRLDDLVQIGALSGAQRHGLQVAEPLDLRLEHGPDGGDDDGDRAGLGVVGAGVREAAQHGEATAHGVGARGEPLVRERLPRGVLDDAVRRQQRAQCRGQILGLPPGGGHGQHGPPGPPREGGHREGPRGGRADEVDVRAAPVGGDLHRFGERRVSTYGVQQTVQAHEGLPSR